MSCGCIDHVTVYKDYSNELLNRNIDIGHNCNGKENFKETKYEVLRKDENIQKNSNNYE